MKTSRRRDDECRFGRFCLQPARRQLLADEQPVKLGARAFDVLLTLVEQRDRVVGKHELLDRVWPDTVVAENNLEVHIWSLRKLLGHRAIVTIPGRGYRFAERLDEPPPARQPAAAREAAWRTNLPAHLPPLMGRDDDLAALGRLADAQALITIVGAGGIGKTLLALHLLERQRHVRAHGVCWVELGALSDPALVAGTVASALGVRLAGGEPLAALAAAVAPLKLLLALDSAEHLLPEVARLVETLLARAGGVQLLVTSQVPLKLAQECQFRLGPLATPEHPVSPLDALSYGAVALFANRAGDAQRPFELSDGNVDAVCTLCRQLDGSALAIELAAARLPLLGVHGLVAALEQRLRLLTKGHRDAPTRQHTLRAALEWSHGLLNADEQTVFRRLAVFSGGCTLELAQAVIGDARLDRWRVLDAIDALVDHSLVSALGGEPPRYRLLESPHALAAELLAASGEQPALRRRHAFAVQAHFGKLVDETRRGARRVDSMLALLEPDVDNARSALGWALGQAPACAVALARPLTHVLGDRRYAEGRRLWQATEGCLSDALPSALLADWYSGAADFSGEHDPAIAQVWARRAAELFRQLGDTQGLARALIQQSRSRSAGALELRRQALAELRSIEQPDWPPLLRMRRAAVESILAYHSGDLAQAGRLMRQWHALADEAGSGPDRSAARINLAEVALAGGNPAEAARLGRELEHEWANSREITFQAITQVNLCAALMACNDLAAARELARVAWPAAPQFALQPYWADSMALLAALEGRARCSARLRGYGDAIYRQRDEQREPNEQRSATRAETIARAALGDTAFDELCGDGARLSHAQAGVLALAPGDDG